MNYAKMLEDGYAAMVSFGEGPRSRLQYLSDHIFDFTTYDDAMAELFASKALEVCAAISGRKTFEYIEDEDNYRWYLVMCNMPFFAERLEWGASVRGAWWQYNIEYSSCGLWDGDRQAYETMAFTKDEWARFIADLLAFAAIAQESPASAKPAGQGPE